MREINMLKEILDPQICARCRICCVFDSSDIWETPVFTPETAEMIRSAKPETNFIPHGNGFIIDPGELGEGELFTCPALTENGCILGDNKPFDCRIWPFRIMEIGGIRGITVASICKEVYSRPLSQLVEFLDSGLAETIFSYADVHPEIVKPYDYGYPILKLERKEK